MLFERLQALWTFLKLLARNYRDDSCQTTAAALTYQTLFAVVPLLTITYTVLASFEAFEGMGEMLQNFLFANLLPESVATMEGYLAEFSDQARQLSIPSLIVVTITAFLMMFTIERALNEIWQVREPRQGFQRILMYWAILTLGPVFLVVSIVSTTYLLSLPFLSDVSETIGLLSLLPLLMSIAFFTLVFVAVPNCFVPLRHAFSGGVLVAALFEASKQLFGSVMSQTGFEVIYGTFAAVPLFLIWVYLTWTIVLFGAEFTKGIGLYDSEKSDAIEPPLLQLLIILEEFFCCHQRGDVVTERRIAKLSQRVDMQQWHEHKSLLLGLGLIRQVEKGGLVLSRDLSEINVWDLYRQLPWPLPRGFTQANGGWQSELDQQLAEVFGTGRESLNSDIESLFRMGTS